MREEKEEEGGKAKESAESVFAALERAPVLCSVVPSTVHMPHCAFESAVPHCAFKRTVLTLPHCAPERAPDQTLRFGSGKHFSLPPTCANCVILQKFFFLHDSVINRFSGHFNFFELVIKSHLTTTTTTRQLERMLLKSENLAKCDCCHDFTAHNLREPQVSQIFVKAASQIFVAISRFMGPIGRPVPAVELNALCRKTPLPHN